MQLCGIVTSLAVQLQQNIKGEGWMVRMLLQNISQYYNNAGPNVSNVTDCSINIIFTCNDFVFSFHVLPSEMRS